MYLYLLFLGKKVSQIWSQMLWTLVCEIGTLVDMNELKQISVYIRTKSKVFVIEFDWLLLT